MTVRNFVFTINNPDESDEVQLRSPPEHVRYMVYQHEVGEEGTPHYQGYVELSKSVKLAGLKKWLTRAHLEKRKGNRDQARAYCMKTDTQTHPPIEYGDWHSGGSGKRNDLAEIQKKIHEGKPMREIAQEHFGSWLRYADGFKKYKKLVCQPARPKRKLEEFLHEPLNLDKTTLIYGPSGTGKTNFALAHFDNALLVSTMDDLAEYDPQEHDGIVFDDVNFSDRSATELIHLVDQEMPRSIRVRYVCAHIPANTKKIVTHQHRTCLYPHYCPDDQKNAIDRRLNVVEITAPLFD